MHCALLNIKIDFSLKVTQKRCPFKSSRVSSDAFRCGSLEVFPNHSGSQGSSSPKASSLVKTHMHWLQSFVMSQQSLLLKICAFQSSKGGSSKNSLSTVSCFTLNEVASKIYPRMLLLSYIISCAVTLTLGLYSLCPHPLQACSKTTPGATICPLTSSTSDSTWCQSTETRWK